MPLVYTQVVHLAVYVYFAASLVGEQWIIWKQEGDEEVDLYYPVFMTVRWEAQVDNRFFLLSLLNLYLEVHFSSKFY